MAGGFWAPRTAHAAALTTISAVPTGAFCNLQYATQDVFYGPFTGLAAPGGEPSPSQRLTQLNPVAWRINSSTDGGTGGLSVPFPAPYTSADGLHVPAWDFTHLDYLLGEAPQTIPHVLSITTPPDVMFTGTGNLGPTGGPPPSGTLGEGTLQDQTYGALATYMANVVRYYNTGISVTDSGASVTYTATSLTDSTVDFTPYGGGAFSVTVDMPAADGQHNWQTAVITGVTTSHTIHVASWPSGTPAAAAAYNVGSTAGPISGAAGLTPWPRPPSVGPIPYFEIMNEPDLSNSFFPRTSPKVLPPLPVLTPLATGSIPGGTKVSYRISAMSIGGSETLAGTEATITLTASQHGVKLTWNSTTNLGLSPFAYGIYGRTTAAEQAMVVVGRDSSSVLATSFSWTDDGSVTPSGGFTGGGLPGTDSTVGYQLFRPHEYRRMWDSVVPAMKAVDATIKVVGPTISNPTSLAAQDVVPTVVTTGPGDTSWLDTTDDFISVLMSAPTHPPNVVSVHGYGGSGGSADSDYHMLTGASQGEGIDGILSQYAATVQPFVGSTPVWQTETNDNASDVNAGDVRTITQLDGAWLASEFARVCTTVPQVQTLFQFEYSISNTFQLLAPGAGPSCAGDSFPVCTGIKQGRPTIAFWTLKFLNSHFPRGSKLLTVTGVPAGFDVIAVEPPPFDKIDVLVVNRQFPSNTSMTPLGVAGTVNLALTGAVPFATHSWTLDQGLDLLNGPSSVDLAGTTTPVINSNGFGLTIVEFSLAAAPPTVSLVVPNSGPPRGGTSVTITGTSFITVSGVHFGAAAARSFTVNGPTSITAVSPNGSGIADITVTASGGTSATTALDQFFYGGGGTAQSGALPPASRGGVKPAPPVAPGPRTDKTGRLGRPGTKAPAGASGGSAAFSTTSSTPASPFLQWLTTIVGALLEGWLFLLR
jgi:hypothetical protein